MILVCAAGDFWKFQKNRQIINFFKTSYKICHKQNVKCLGFFSSWLGGLHSHVLEFNKKKTALKPLFFFIK